MGTDEIYEAWLSNECAYSLSNWADLILQKLEDVEPIEPLDISNFKKALNDFDVFYGFAEICPTCNGKCGFAGNEGESGEMCIDCNGRGVIPIKHNCPLCDKPSKKSEVHKECSDREKYLADKE
jgi:RecJ-like exonuclease